MGRPLMSARTMWGGGWLYGMGPCSRLLRRAAPRRVVAVFAGRVHAWRRAATPHSANASIGCIALSSSHVTHARHHALPPLARRSMRIFAAASEEAGFGPV